jgi:hypothetical protein
LEGSSANRNVVMASGVEKERGDTAGGVLVAGGVLKKRLKSVPCVPVAGCVLTKRINTAGCVKVAGIREPFAAKRTNTNGRVVAAGCVARERSRTASRVETTGAIAKECLTTIGSVIVTGIKSVCAVTAKRIDTGSRVELPLVFPPSALEPVAVLSIRVV